MDSNKKLIELINKNIAPEILSKHSITAEYIANDIERTKFAFKITNKTLEEIFAGEAEYYINFGMNAFDAGYCGLTNKNKK